jgi:hypothetical protein
MGILWDPEIAVCTECGARHVVRRYTSDGFHRIFCYRCWHKMQNDMELDDSEWIERSCIVMESEQRHGTTQEYQYQ